MGRTTSLQSGETFEFKSDDLARDKADSLATTKIASDFFLQPMFGAYSQCRCRNTSVQAIDKHEVYQSGKFVMATERDDEIVEDR